MLLDPRQVGYFMRLRVSWEAHYPRLAVESLLFALRNEVAHKVGVNFLHKLRSLHDHFEPIVKPESPNAHL